MKICKLCTEFTDRQYYGFCKNCYKEIHEDVFQDEIEEHKKGVHNKCLETKKVYYINNKDKYKMWHAKRRRKMGWTKLFPNPFASDIPIHWHHYDDEFVVALPRDIHMMFLGNNHRENLNPIIHQIYL